MKQLLEENQDWSGDTLGITRVSVGVTATTATTATAAAAPPAFLSSNCFAAFAIFRIEIPERWTRNVELFLLKRTDWLHSCSFFLYKTNRKKCFVPLSKLLGLRIRAGWEFSIAKQVKVLQPSWHSQVVWKQIKGTEHGGGDSSSGSTSNYGSRGPRVGFLLGAGLFNSSLS